MEDEEHFHSGDFSFYAQLVYNLGQSLNDWNLKKTKLRRENDLIGQLFTPHTGAFKIINMIIMEFIES